MFLRKLKRKKDGKTHTYWALVESYRTARGPRHRTVAYLGELQKGQRKGWANLSHTLEGKQLRGLQSELFGEEPQAQQVPENVKVNIRGVRVEKTTEFGDVWLALLLWRTLGLDELFKDILPDGREDVEWSLMAAVLAIARFCKPSSELRICDAWYPGTALPELLGVPSDKV